MLSSILAATTLVESPSAGIDAVQLTSSNGWTASSNDTWLHVHAGSSSGAGDAVVKFDVDANAGATRTGTLTIDGLTLTVIQASNGYIAGVVPATIVSGLNGPCGITVDGSGNVIFADNSNNALKLWDASTQQVTTLVSSGMNSPYGVAVDRFENVYIANRMGNSILEWNSTSGLTTLVSSGLVSPMGVAVDSDGNVYISDTNHNSVKKWDAQTHAVSTLISSGLSLPVGLAFDTSGNLLIADAGNSAIRQWNATDGLTTIVSSGLNCPYDVAADAAGKIYIADTNGNGAKLWNPDTQTLTSLVSSGLNFPVGMTVDASGDVFITDTMHNVVKELPRSYLSTAAVSLPSPASSNQLPTVVFAPQAPAGFLTATSDQSWLTITDVTNGVVSYSCTANTATTSRTAHITLLGRQITLTQAGRNTPTFSGLSAPTITYGASTTTISGTLNPNGGGQMVPTSEYVSITINGVTQQAYLDTNDQFTTTFDTHALHYRASGYTISYSYAGDASFTSASTSRTLTVARFSFSYQIGAASHVYGSTASLAASLGTTIDTGINGEKLGITYSSSGNTISAHVQPGGYAINGSLSNNTGLTADYTVTPIDDDAPRDLRRQLTGGAVCAVVALLAMSQWWSAALRVVLVYKGSDYQSYIQHSPLYRATDFDVSRIASLLGRDTQAKLAVMTGNPWLARLLRLELGWNVHLAGFFLSRLLLKLGLVRLQHIHHTERRPALVFCDLLQLLQRHRLLQFCGDPSQIDTVFSGSFRPFRFRRGPARLHRCRLQQSLPREAIVLF